MENTSNDKTTDAGTVEISAHDEVVNKFLSETETAASYFRESLPREITTHNAGV